MKKIKWFAVIVILAIIGFCSSGCALKAKGYGIKPSKVKSIPYNTVTAQTQNNSALEQKMDAMINGLNNLASAINKKSVAHMLQKTGKKPEVGAFSRKIISAKKTEEKYYSKNSYELNKLKTRIALLEDQMSDTGAGAVYFGLAKSDLSSKAKTWLEKNVVQPWFNGEIDITGINGYASKTKPKNQNISNMDYAKQRAIAVQHYLSYRGVQTGDIKITVKGPTTRFGNNLNVTVVWDNINNKTEKNKKKEDRKQYIVNH